MASDATPAGPEPVVEHTGIAKTVVVATKNRGKVAEIRSALGFEGWHFVSADELDCFWPSPEEDGETFEDNARIKAKAAYERFGMAALADDSGLEVDALDGAPGVFSSRFSGPCATDEQNNERLLLALKDVPAEQRTARFRSVIVLIDEDGTELSTEGACEGSIGFEPRGEGGFGYDPLFLPKAAPGRTMAELSLAEKNQISHRGAALRAMHDVLAGLNR
jgi:XTP/dITP diphosphohydrolase